MRITHYFLLITFLLIFLLSFNSPSWAAGEHQTVPTVTPGGGTPALLPNGLATPTATTSADPNNSLMPLVITLAGGGIVLSGLIGGGLYVWSGLKRPKIHKP